MSDSLNGIREFDPGIPMSKFQHMLQCFPPKHFLELMKEKIPFYTTTFWYSIHKSPENIFESVIESLIQHANPCKKVIGVEWWFSVLLTNTTPYWLLGCHFDRNDLSEKDFSKIRHPEFASVLFINSVPYGELVVTDQILTESGISPRHPKEMHFIQPKQNVYAVFPGHLYHGVIGRMWRPHSETKLRIAMAVNYWTEKPMTPYMADSRDCISKFKLNSVLKTASC